MICTAISLYTQTLIYDVACIAYWNNLLVALLKTKGQDCYYSNASLSCVFGSLLHAMEISTLWQWMVCNRYAEKGQLWAWAERWVAEVVTCTVGRCLHHLPGYFLASGITRRMHNSLHRLKYPDATVIADQLKTKEKEMCWKLCCLSVIIKSY